MSTETQIASNKAQQDEDIATGVILPEQQKAADPKPLPKTSGEKFYSVVQFVFGKLFILTAGIVLAIAADEKLGPEKLGHKKVFQVPNFLKQFQKWTEDKVVRNKHFSLEEKGPYARLAGYAFATTLITSHGGNLFAPFMLWLENRKQQISNLYNKHFGKPGEVEIASERLKDQPKQGWKDIIKGRLMGWVVVFSSILGVYAAMGRTKLGNREEFRMKYYEDFVGRLVAGMFGGKEGKEIWETPLKQELTDKQKLNKTHRLGELLAIDFIATSAGLIVWNIASRRSARKRQQKEEALEKMTAGNTSPEAASEKTILPETLSEEKNETTKQTKVSATLENGYAQMLKHSSEATEQTVLTP
jgi:hypothetical protein